MFRIPPQKQRAKCVHSLAPLFNLNESGPWYRLSDKTQLAGARCDRSLVLNFDVQLLAVRPPVDEEDTILARIRASVEDECTRERALATAALLNLLSGAGTDATCLGLKKQPILEGVGDTHASPRHRKGGASCVWALEILQSEPPPHSLPDATRCIGVRLWKYVLCCEYSDSLLLDRSMRVAALIHKITDMPVELQSQKQKKLKALIASHDPTLAHLRVSSPQQLLACLKAYGGGVRGSDCAPLVQNWDAYLKTASTDTATGAAVVITGMLSSAQTLPNRLHALAPELLFSHLNPRAVRAGLQRSHVACLAHAQIEPRETEPVRLPELARRDQLIWLLAPGLAPGTTPLPRFVCRSLDSHHTQEEERSCLEQSARKRARLLPPTEPASSS